MWAGSAGAGNKAVLIGMICRRSLSLGGELDAVSWRELLADQLDVAPRRVQAQTFELGTSPLKPRTCGLTDSGRGQPARGFSGDGDFRQICISHRPKGRPVQRRAPAPSVPALPRRRRRRGRDASSVDLSAPARPPAQEPR